MGVHYRSRAVTPLAEVRRSTRLPRLVGVPALLVAGIATLVIAAVLAWVLLGTVEERVVGTGLLIREPGLTPIDAPADGLIVESNAHVGDAIEAGSPLAVIELPDGTRVPATSPTDGVVSAVSTAAGEVVRVGQRLATLEPPDGPLAAIVFVDAFDAARIEPGMEVFVWPLGTSPAEEGATIGAVSDVETFPATIAQLESALQAAPLVASLSTSPVVEVTVTLGAEDQLDWTLAEPARAQARPGRVVEAQITVSSERPIEAILGSP